ncbi:MAG: efflux transporter periplasmic adaptor subunit [Bacteroidetes bacterium]|nr:MAG: efflux transporter periplasmic adaptor subunit [Bacteroidota bacterium]
MNKIIKNKWVVIVLVLFVGIAIGKFLGGGNSDKVEEVNQLSEVETAQFWTCSMHPQIQQDGPGSCPLCGMDLIPLDNGLSSDEALPDEVPMSDAAMKLAEIQTFITKLESPEKELRLLGKVKADERLQFSQVIHFPGRIEKLHVNFTGEKVRKGQKLATIYSAELVTAQKELFEVLKSLSTSQVLVDAARNKLKQWKFTDEQISGIEKSGKVQTEVDILSDYSGYVMMRMVSEGDHVKEGQTLFQITDLSKVWLLFEAYENDLPWIKLGDALSIEVRSIPGKLLKGSVAYIDPFLNPKTRVAYVRVELPNSKGLLKPDMFATGIVKSKLSVNEDVILVPKSAVLWTGKRSVVYVKMPNRAHNSFLYREVILGEDAGDFYIIVDGLVEGEEIASNGVFKIDAAAQLSGKKSMMNPSGGKSSSGGHAGMDMGEEDGMKDMVMKPNVTVDRTKVPSKFRKQLGEVVDQYLLLKDKLVGDNAAIQDEVKAIQFFLKRVDMNLVMGDAHKVWMTALKSLDKDLRLLSKSVNIGEQRSIFLTLSTALSDVSQLLGVVMKEDRSLYLEYCPMADDNKGGYWLSTEEKIQNPYFGAKMLKCGSVKQVIK